MYKFIFIDDEDLARSFFSNVLDYSTYGFSLAAMFSTAEKAMEYLEYHNDIAVVITDIKMGSMSGIDFCEKVREHNEDILLVCLSGYKDFNYAQRAIKCNVFDYLLKPTLYEDIEMLFVRLKKHLDQHRPTGNMDSQTAISYTDFHYESIIDMVKKYIEDNYARDVSLESVAQHVSMNPTYLSRFFKQHTQSNFLDYLSKYRMDKAIEFLHDPTVRIGEICGMVGYKTPQHFNKFFKQHTGCTPSEFRLRVLERR